MPGHRRKSSPIFRWTGCCHRLDPNAPSAPVSYTPTAATTTPDGLGGHMHVLLADHVLSEILSLRRHQIPGVTPAPTAMPAYLRGQIREAAAFGKQQLFLAETAMIASERPGASRAVVAAPPRR